MTDVTTAAPDNPNRARYNLWLLCVAGLVFVLSIPLIALSKGHGALLVGRLLQGISGGFIGGGVPLYLAECLVSKSRGKGTAIFQWLLTFGIVADEPRSSYASEYSSNFFWRRQLGRPPDEAALTVDDLYLCGVRIGKAFTLSEERLDLWQIALQRSGR